MTDPIKLDQPRIGLIADTHGDVGGFGRQMRALASLGVREVVVLGDFEIVRREPDFAERAFLDKAEAAVNAAGIERVLTLMGNHDQPTSRWRDRFGERDGLSYARPWLAMLPRAGVLAAPDSNSTVAFLAGAASVDRDREIRHSWAWNPEEEIRQDDIDALPADADVFLAHEGGSPGLVQRLKATPFWPEGALEFAERSQQLWRDAAEHTRARLTVSGHHHRFVDDTWVQRFSDGMERETRSIVLDQAGGRGVSTMVLDMATIELTAVELGE